MVKVVKCIGLSKYSGVSQKSGKEFNRVTFYGVSQFSEFDSEHSEVFGVSTFDMTLFDSDLEVCPDFAIDKTYEFNFVEDFNTHKRFLRSVKVLDR